MELRTTRLPECRCPWCHRLMDAATSANRNRPNAVPKPGDVSVCIHCAQVLIFQDNLTVRATMPGEVEMTPAIRLAVAAAKSLERRH